MRTWIPLLSTVVLLQAAAAQAEIIRLTVPVTVRNQGNVRVTLFCQVFAASGRVGFGMDSRGAWIARGTTPVPAGHVGSLTVEINVPEGQDPPAGVYECDLRGPDNHRIGSPDSALQARPGSQNVVSIRGFIPRDR